MLDEVKFIKMYNDGTPWKLLERVFGITKHFLKKIAEELELEIPKPQRGRIHKIDMVSRIHIRELSKPIPVESKENFQNREEIESPKAEGIKDLKVPNSDI